MLTKKDLTYERVKAAVLKKKHKFFTGHMNVNMIGIRTSNRKADNFDDFFCLLWEENGVPVIWVNDKFTTDPGIYYLKEKLLNPKGCGILAEGQYRGVWKIGKHLGKYEAFLQLGAPVTAYRDRNKDNILDFDPKTLTHGYFGCNQHHGYSSTMVDRNSAMCQVHQKAKDLEYVLSVAKKGVKWGNTYTYTLLNEADIELT